MTASLSHLNYELPRDFEIPTALLSFLEDFVI